MKNNMMSGSVLSLYICVLKYGYVVKSCKKFGSHYKILLIHGNEDPSIANGKDMVIRLYSQGVFERHG